MIYRNFLFKNRLPLLNRGLDAYAMRQKTISKNMANATTPYYRPERVKFEEFFQEPQVTAFSKGTDDQHIPVGKGQVNMIEGEIEKTPIPEPEIFFEGESHVNIDKEMSELAKNQIRFRFAARMVKRFFGGLNNAITGIRE